MSEESTEPRPAVPDASELAKNPEQLKDAHQKYGKMLKEAGLPFEPEELEDDESETPDPSAD